jgi:hypothetical protein
MYRDVLLMTLRQGIHRDILAVGFEFDVELIAEHLAHPSVLGNHREPLVQEVLAAEVIGPYDEWPRLEIRPPVPHDLDDADELPLVRCELGVMWRLKNANGPVPWWSTTSKPEPDASQSTMKGLVKSDSWTTGAEVSALFNALNATTTFGD